jgi:hypothetical protein
MRASARPMQQCDPTGLAARLIYGLALAAGLSASVAGAQSPGTSSPESLTRNDFSIDLVTGPIVGPNRVVSLGGAYTALGYGIDNAATTPAAYGARTLWDTRWFEWDVTLDYSPGAFRHTDFDNNGKSGVTNSDFLFVTGGASAIIDDVGFGALVRLQDYRIGRTAQLGLIIANYGACYTFLDGQLLIGASARTAALTITDTTTQKSLVSFTGTGPEVGAILGLADLPFRIGAAARSGVTSAQDNKAHTALGLTLPRSVSLPPEVQLGFAYQLGSRPLNRRWVNPHDRERDLRNEMLARRLQRKRDQVDMELANARLRRVLETGPPTASVALPDSVLDDADAVLEPHEREFWQAEIELREREERELRERIMLAELRHRNGLRALSRRYVLLSVDALLIGSTEAGVGLESFLSQVRQVSGHNPAIGIRFGAEGEPIQNRLKLRVGSYLEPSRFADSAARMHATLGLDLRLFSWDMFGIVDEFDLRITAALDLAERYRNFGFSVGIWH